jgi:hypothetical protein
MTSDAICTREVKHRIAWQSSMQQRDFYCNEQIGLNVKEEAVEVLYLEQTFVWC